MDFHLFKMQGCGNDFLIVDGMRGNSADLTRNDVEALCDRTFGVGADGLVILQPSQNAQCKWVFYNSDGSQAEMCGNAARCTIRFLTDKYFQPDTVLAVETAVGIIKGKTLPDNRVEVTLFPGGAFELEYKEKLIKDEDGQVYRVCFLNTGVPHAVIEVESIKGYPITKVGRYLVKHPAFGEKGTNVTFFQKKMGPDILATTFERGVEKETYACGTGVAAAAVVYSQLYFQPFPIRVSTPGGEIEADLTQGKALLLRGPAEYIMECDLTLDSDQYARRKLFEGEKNEIV